MIALGVIFWSLIITVPVLVGTALLGLLVWRLFALPIGPAIYWSAVCLLALPATRFVFAATNDFEPNLDPHYEWFTRYATYLGYGVIGAAWLVGLVAALIWHFARRAPIAFTPRVGIAFGAYLLVAVALLVAPSLIHGDRTAKRVAFTNSVIAGDLASVRQQIVAGADLVYSYAQLDGQNVMQYAIKQGQPELVALLIELGPRSTFTPLAYMGLAAEEGDPAIVLPFLNAGADINASNGEALMRAAQANKLEVMQLLLERGANPNIKALMGGWTPLMEVSYDNPSRMELVELLLRYNADVSLQNDQGDTALALAERQGNQDVVAALRAAGAQS